jgi:hypothetical protein
LSKVAGHCQKPHEEPESPNWGSHEFDRNGTHHLIKRLVGMGEDTSRNRLQHLLKPRGDVRTTQTPMQGRWHPKVVGFPTSQGSTRIRLP